MKIFQTILILFSLVLFSNTVWAFEKCLKTDIPSIDLDTFDAGSGSIEFESVTICTKLNSSLKVTEITGDGTVVYHSFAPSNRPEVSFVADGSHELDYFADEDIMRLTYTEGPVNYQVDGKNYEVFYQNLLFILNLSGDVLESSGGVTVNGQYFDSSSLPYEYFKIF